MSAPFNPRVHKINPYRFVISQLEEYIVYLNNITTDMENNRAAVVNYIGRMHTQKEKNALQSNTDTLIAPATMLLSKNIPELMSKYKKLLDDALQKQSDLQKKYEHFERTGDHFAEMNEMIYANAIESTLISYQNELNVIMKIYYKLNDDGIAIYTAHKIDYYHLNKKNQSGKSNQSKHASENRHDASLASIKEENSTESSGGRRRKRTMRKKRTLRKKRALRSRRALRNRA